MQKRRKVLLEEVGVYGFRELCCVAFEQAAPPIPTHIHPDAIEICFLYRGEQCYVVDGQQYTMKGMDVFMTFANEAHGTGKMLEEKNELLYYLIIDTCNHLDRFLGFQDGSTAWLALQLNNIPCRHFRGNERIRTFWEELFHIYDSTHTMRTILLRCAALQLLNEILNCSNNGFQCITPDIQKTINFIHDHIEDWITVDMLAEISGLSESRFKQKFRMQLGIPPGEFVLREKINRAEYMFQHGNSVTKTAYELNFSSSQYLAQVFKKYRGISPRQCK